MEPEQVDPRIQAVLVAILVLSSLVYAVIGSPWFRNLQYPTL